MMTLNEKIQKYETLAKKATEKANLYNKLPADELDLFKTERNECLMKANEFTLIADWLKELKIYQESDCISKEATIKNIFKNLNIKNDDFLLPNEKTIYNVIKDMPIVTSLQFTNKILTNGDKIQNMFPNVTWKYDSAYDSYCGSIDDSHRQYFKKTWWEAPYNSNN